MSWKTAVVIPILKPDKNSALAESYRPISLLPVLSKLAEKVILARLNDHLERENILIPEQHGFRPRLSTSHQLLRVVEFIKEGNNKDECTAVVFLDIQKAFDRVWYGSEERRHQLRCRPRHLTVAQRYVAKSPRVAE
ncbi:RNA-directed DNA polymerase from mobile element jockey [Trichonephila clavipes]|nr:RNA-directed DNA polymerase from mobile element jockey [Trichonephila clavipes]